jgi:hypothetical protein
MARVFRPARSRGTAWLVGLALLLAAISVLPYAQGRGGPGISLFALFAGAFAFWLLLLAYWFPTMRRESS